MKKLIYTWMVLASILAVSCSENDVTPDLKDVTTPFLPAANDQSEEAQMRRQFYQDYGAFLLFNDTLQHEALGTDVNGDLHYFNELLDLNYTVGMSTASNEKFRFTLMTDLEQKQNAVKYIEDYLLPHLTAKMMPWSWLLVDQIHRDYIGVQTSPYAVTGQRAVVIACNVLPRLSDAQNEQYTAQVMNAIISKLAGDNADAFGEFYQVSMALYDGNFPAPKTEKENMALLNEVGFICRGKNYLNNEVNGLYPNQDLDMKAFARLVVANSEEKLQQQYADYPMVLTKCEIMRRILKSLGYVE